MLWFALLCGLAGETLETQRLLVGGMAPPDLQLRATLLIAYALIGAFFLGIARLIAGRERAFATAAALFGIFLVVPWLNFDYLPKWNSLRTIVLTAAATAALVPAAFLATRFPRVSAALLVVAGVVVNASAWATARGTAKSATTTASGAAGPSVIVLLIDTLRADHLGTYGYARPTSPEIDRLAKRAVVFERAVAQASWTKPSVASLLTGAFVHRHGVIESRDALGSELPTLAERMRAHGYRTAAFSANPWITPEFHFNRGFDDFESGRAMGPQLTNLYRVLSRGQRPLRKIGLRGDVTDWIFWTSGEPSLGNSERDEVLTDAVLEWLDRHHANPFFAYIHLIGPHDPYDPPREFADRFRDPSRADLPRPIKPPARVQSIFETAEPLDGDAMEGLRAQYDGAIAFTDMLVGRIAARLEKLGLLDETLLVVVSDHGEEFYEHRNWRHGNQLYDEVIHVPMIFRLPERLNPQRSSEPSMLVDVFPTVLGVLGLPNDVPTLDGRNVLDAAAHGPRPIFAEHWRFEGGEYVSRAVSRDGLKLTETRDVTASKEGSELYDLKADPREQTNLLPGGGDQAATGELKALLAGFQREKPFAAAPAVDVDRSTEERLRALGYQD